VDSSKIIHYMTYLISCYAQTSITLFNEKFHNLHLFNMEVTWELEDNTKMKQWGVKT